MLHEQDDLRKDSGQVVVQSLSKSDPSAGVMWVGISIGTQVVRAMPSDLCLFSMDL